MDRLFLDADVLFTAAWRPKAAISTIWQLENVTLMTSLYAFAQAEQNIESKTQARHLNNLAVSLYFVGTPAVFELPEGIRLPPLQRPILAAAIEGQATHLITGNRSLYEPYYGNAYGGVLVSHPMDYLKDKLGVLPD